MLWLEQGANAWLPAFDGNGNVMALIDNGPTSGTIAVRYEYGPLWRVVDQGWEYWILRESVWVEHEIHGIVRLTWFTMDSGIIIIRLCMAVGYPETRLGRRVD